MSGGKAVSVNLDTGKVYRTTADIEAARARGERIAPVSEEVAMAVEAGQRLINRPRGNCGTGCRTPREFAAARGDRIGRVVDRDARGYDKSPYELNRHDRRKLRSKR